MKITLLPTPDGSTIDSSDNGITTFFPIPLPPADVAALIAQLLRSPDTAYVERDMVQFTRTREAVSIRTTTGSFEIHWTHLHAVDGLFV